jgi:hypothetical protein
MMAKPRIRTEVNCRLRIRMRFDTDADTRQRFIVAIKRFYVSTVTLLPHNFVFCKHCLS